MQQHFQEQLVELWENKLFHQREVLNYSLDGSEVHVHLQFSVFPGHEARWDLVLVALADITVRKKARSVSGIPRQARRADQAQESLVSISMKSTGWSARARSR